jgi:hypothetical protein
MGEAAIKMWRMYDACWISEATRAQVHSCARALHQHQRASTHTEICTSNTYCIPTSKIRFTNESQRYIVHTLPVLFKAEVSGLRILIVSEMVKDHEFKT